MRIVKHLLIPVALVALAGCGSSSQPGPGDHVTAVYHCTDGSRIYTTRTEWWSSSDNIRQPLDADGHSPAAALAYLACAPS